ncbi:glycosyltransferase family 2 protein [Paracraurococcus lichenis]|uniref:Glycosyltransferase family A protein n=1 Tax=Paracraurococcus lichenis TaxID=3064888 RepID=A0ABT9EDT3_9PROT|nr:glycosyltransferase family A protein [Paracraurococcus sp. LOR1-02]MDO9714397.1 glycosyltransferase family A protein [Paracraurococcus sp. LOR1-02]
MTPRTKRGDGRLDVGKPELVAVVIPAYNAAATIDETLRSVRNQTHRALEIMVVDDGSTDGTAAIVEGHAFEDCRVKLFRQSNAGVAAARNRGIAEAEGELVAPIDADDLWHPHKIERQLQALRAGGEAVGLVYTWTAFIDQKSRIISLHDQPTDEGYVLDRMCLGNLLGNGSSALMRKTVVLEAGSYDPSLRAMQAQGCEDYQLYLKIAARYRFAVVREHLTGYRSAPGRMSDDLMQMIRSFELVASALSEERPDLAHLLRKGRENFLHHSYRHAIMAANAFEAASLASWLLRANHGLAVTLAWEALSLPARRAAKLLFKSLRSGPAFPQAVELGIQ